MFFFINLPSSETLFGKEILLTTPFRLLNKVTIYLIKPQNSPLEGSPTVGREGCFNEHPPSRFARHLPQGRSLALCVVCIQLLLVKRVCFFSFINLPSSEPYLVKRFVNHPFPPPYQGETEGGQKKDISN